MTRSRVAMLFAVALGCLALPATARAQSAFAGVVKDATGAVLPGVTVEASSPALIEKVRSVTTDANGLYRIENLRPGTYTITFNLPGFSAVKRDGVEGPDQTFFSFIPLKHMVIGGLAWRDGGFPNPQPVP